LRWHNILFCFFGVFIGTLVAYCGIGRQRVALLIPITRRSRHPGPEEGR